MLCHGNTSLAAWNASQRKMKNDHDSLLNAHNCVLHSCWLCGAELLLTTFHRTSYDAVTKQHWLSVYRGKLKTRFLLKDSLTDAATVEDLIARAVDAMIAKLSKTK